MSAAGLPQGTCPLRGAARSDARGVHKSSAGPSQGAVPAASTGACLLLFAAAAAACGEELRGTTQAIEGEHYVVVFRTVPDPIAVGEHFALDFTMCPRAKGDAPRSVRVDASMPEHRHGMNYRPVVTARAVGTYRADGLLFHMPGRWDLVFDVVGGGGTERLTGTMRIE
jgi:hypothetical protein